MQPWDVANEGFYLVVFMPTRVDFKG